MAISGMKRLAIMMAVFAWVPAVVFGAPVSVYDSTSSGGSALLDDRYGIVQGSYFVPTSEILVDTVRVYFQSSATCSVATCTVSVGVYTGSGYTSGTKIAEALSYSFMRSFVPGDYVDVPLDNVVTLSPSVQYFVSVQGIDTNSAQLPVVPRSAGGGLGYTYDSVCATPYGWKNSYPAPLTGCKANEFGFKFSLVSSQVQPQRIQITSPTHMGKVVGQTVNVTVAYSNPSDWPQINVCLTDATSTLSFFADYPCVDGGVAYSIGAEGGTLSFSLNVGTTASSSRNIYVGFGPTLSAMEAGRRFVDFDVITYGFNNMTPPVDQRISAMIASGVNDGASWRCAMTGIMDFASSTMCVLVWAFVPSTDSLSAIVRGMSERLADEFPFSIPLQIQDMIATFDSSSSTVALSIDVPTGVGTTSALTIYDSTSFADIPPQLKTVLSVMRDGMAFILWLSFIIGIWKVSLTFLKVRHGVEQTN